MDRRIRLIRFWEFLKVPSEVIEACSVEYDLLCPHCRLAGRGDVHVVLLPDDTGFECAAVGHQYRSHRREYVPGYAESFAGPVCVPS